MQGPSETLRSSSSASGRKGRNCLLLLLLGGVVGCGGRGLYLRDAKDPNSAFVFIAVDMSEAHCGLDYFQVRQVLPRVEEPYRNLRTHLGVAYREDMPLGSYQVSALGGDGMHYRFSSQSGGVRIQEPGFNFLGSYKLRRAPNNADGSELVAVEDPTEAVVLGMILPYAKGTEWTAKIQGRIKALEGK